MLLHSRLVLVYKLTGLLVLVYVLVYKPLQHRPKSPNALRPWIQKEKKEVVYQSVVSVHGTHMPGLAPAIITMRRAMRLCRFHFSMDAARQMTPISSRVVSLQYSAAT